MPKKPIDHNNGQPDRSRLQRGATVVEFAFIAGLVFLVIFGILEFGLIFLQEHYVANAAREAARIGVRANNYSCFNQSGSCISRVQRTGAAIDEYLNIFYEPAEIDKTISQQTTSKSLVVRIAIDNDNIVRSGIIPFNHDIIFTTALAYEDPKEFDDGK